MTYMVTTGKLPVVETLENKEKLLKETEQGKIKGK